MGLNLGDQFPNFQALTSEGPIDFYEWMQDSWAILFSHPSDFTPVCTTELARVASLSKEFRQRNVKPIALSCDSVQSHRSWIEDIKKYGDLESFDYPIIADERRELAKQLQMIDKDELDDKGIPLTCRAVFIIDPAKKLRLQILYPATTGRNFDEILRVLDSLMLTSSKPVATPVDWNKGDACMILPTVTTDQATQIFDNNVTTIALPSGKPYLRYTKNL